LRVFIVRAVAGERGIVAIVKIFSSGAIVLEKVEILDQRDRRQWKT
jgi:hypothetical protein